MRESNFSGLGLNRHIPLICFRGSDFTFPFFGIVLSRAMLGLGHCLNFYTTPKFL